MAGGPLAANVSCMVCLADEARLTKASRIYDGDEDDRYRCERGHEIGMNWASGPATEPQWPPAQDLVDALAQPT